VDGPIIEDVADLAQAQIQQHLQEVVCATPRPLDLEKERKVQEFYTQECGCKLIKNGPCFSLFAAKNYATMQANAAELSWAELNMVVMGQVMALTFLDNDILRDTTWFPTSHQLLHPSSHQVYQVPDNGTCTIKYESLSRW